MMGIEMPETCSAYKKCNKIISGIYLVSYSSVITLRHGPINARLEDLSLQYRSQSWMTTFERNLIKPE